MHILYKVMLAGALLTASEQSEEAIAPRIVTISEKEVSPNKSQKLIHVKSNLKLVEFNGEETIIHDKILEKEMQERGVLIPPSLRGHYNGKEAVKLGEDGFQRAFKEIFAANIFGSSSYSWEE